MSYTPSRFRIEFLHGPHADPTYKLRRENIFVVAVNCGQAGGTCFCVSMQTGPKATFGFDVALTEIVQGGRHSFVVEAGSEKGTEVLQEVPHREARTDERQAADEVSARTAAHMGRSLDTTEIKPLLYRNYDPCISCATHFLTLNLERE